nr:hypothetical protein [uncultured Pseudomonas sp.]
MAKDAVDLLNGPDHADRIHLHMSPRQGLEGLQVYVRDKLVPILAGYASVLKVQLHLCAAFQNDGNHPPAPDVAHTAIQELADIS